MYLMHKYWARKPHNVVGEYIEHYSKKGEIVLDPFVGSGVTAIEALKRGRKAIAIDLDPMATFITKMTLLPVDLGKFKDAFEEIKTNVKTEIEKLYSTKCPKCGKKATILATVWLRDENQPSEIRLFCPKCKKRLKKKPTSDDLKKNK
jgi:adenine-specific DNA methylase